MCGSVFAKYPQLLILPEKEHKQCVIAPEVISYGLQGRSPWTFVMNVWRTAHYEVLSRHSLEQMVSPRH